MWDLIVSIPDHCLSFYFVASPCFEEVCQIPSAYASSLLHRQHVCCGKMAGGVSKNILWIYKSSRPIRRKSDCSNVQSRGKSLASGVGFTLLSDSKIRSIVAKPAVGCCRSCCYPPSADTTACVGNNTG